VSQPSAGSFELFGSAHVLIGIPAEEAEVHDLGLGEAEEFRIGLHFIEELCLTLVKCQSGVSD